jgi:hypothetical protein
MSARKQRRAVKLVESFGRHLAKYCRAGGDQVEAGDFLLLDDTIKVKLLNLENDSDDFRSKAKKFSNTTISSLLEDSGGYSPYAFIPMSAGYDSDSSGDSGYDEPRNRGGRRHKRKEKESSFFNIQQTLVLISIVIVSWLAFTQVKQLAGLE